MTKGRRAIRFASLRDVPADVDRLLAGNRTLGRWSLAQILNHLAVSIRYTTEGFPGRHAPWLIRKTIGFLVLQLMLRTERIAEGMKIPREYLPAPDLDATCEAEKLRAAIDQLLTATGGLKPHPLVGELSPARWERYHCIHCAHHLSFAIPEASPSQ
jgi:hypothetical protein